MRIFVTGTRGIPGIPGGVEKHCQELYTHIVQENHQTFVCTRTPYVIDKRDSFQGVRLVHVFAPKIKSIEAIFHTFFCIFTAIKFNCDILHIHGIGPSLLVPLARLMGLRVVMTHHGPDYERQKWGRMAKAMLRAGEYLGARFANEVIVISKGIEANVTQKCGRKSNLIYNGVQVPQKSLKTDYLEEIGVLPGKFLLAVARLVPEKGLHDLIGAFQKIDTDFKLVIAGEADHPTDYSNSLKACASNDDRIVLPGYVMGERLNQLFSHARLFVLPSYHEGLPIALLEALSYGVPPLVSDIPANKEVGLDEKFYFPCGDVSVMQIKIAKFIGNGIDDTEKNIFQSMVAKNYNWMQIAEQTIKVYKQVINGKR